MKVKTLAEANLKYGVIENKIWADEPKWMVLLKIPKEISVVADYTTKIQTKIYLNKDIIDPLNQVFTNLIKNNLQKELKIFSGCFCIRDVRGFPGILSAHAYGLALDWRGSEMPLGANSLWTPEFVKTWKDIGWSWGGDFSRKDPMHFSYCWE